MRARLVIAIISIVLEEAALGAIVLLGFPRLGIKIPLPGLIAMMMVWLVYSVFTYRVGSRALRRKQLDGLPNMVGSRGKVVNSLAPEGLVRVKGELWVAKAASGEMEPGEEVIVTQQDGLKLVVCKSSLTGDLDNHI